MFFFSFLMKTYLYLKVVTFLSLIPFYNIYILNINEKETYILNLTAILRKRKGNQFFF